MNFTCFGIVKVKVEACRKLFKNIQIIINSAVYTKRKRNIYHFRCINLVTLSLLAFKERGET